MAGTDFPTLERYIADRRSELVDELEVLEGIQSERVQLRNKSLDRFGDAAEIVAQKYTSAADVRALLDSELSTRLLGSIPSGLEDTSDTARDNAIKQFLNETLVLFGLSLRTDDAFPEGMLKGAADTLRSTAFRAIADLGRALESLGRLKLEPVGQGRALGTGDLSLDIATSFLAASQEAAERLIANLGAGTDTLSKALVQAVRANLESAGVALHPPDDRLSAATVLVKGIQGSMATIRTNETNVARLKAAVSAFKKLFEAYMASKNSDRAQTSAILDGVKGLLAEVVTARGRLDNVIGQREGWGRTLACLIAIAALGDSEPVQRAFQEPVLAAKFGVLKAGLDAVPDTALDELDFQVSSLLRIYVAQDKSADASARRDLLMGQVVSTLTLIRARYTAILAAIDAVSLRSSDSVARVTTILDRGNLKEASTALKEGDLVTLFRSATDNLSITDKIGAEIKIFREGIPEDSQSNVPMQLSRVFQRDILGSHRDDLTADQDFENSRLKAINTINAELARLTFIEGLVLQARSI